MCYCYIFDYSDGTINSIVVVEEEEKLDGEELLRKYGFKPDNCAWMFTSINYHIIVENG